MKSIRRFAYAVVLTLTTLNFTPSLASAEEPARGRFTLTHEVHWQNAVVPAGEYRFSFEPNGSAGLLTLQKLDGTGEGFMLLVHDTEEAKPSDLSRLLLESTPEGTYVSAMQLPEFGMTLYFTAPERAAAKQMATAVPAAMTASR
jgi:hypothetical protein